MHYESEFLTLAEIGITLAGFAGVTVALFSQSSRGLSDESRARIVAVFNCGLSVVIFAFIPKLASAFIEDQMVSWRIAQFLFCMYHFFCFYLHRTIGGNPLIPAHGVLETYVLFPIALLVAIGQAITSAGFLLESLVPIYFLALLWFIFAGAWHFVVLIWENLPNEV